MVPQRVLPLHGVCLVLALTAVALSAVLHAAPGDLDPSFGTGGRVITPLQTGEDRVSGLAVQADGKILLGGYGWVNANWNHAIVRYLPTGALDTTFNGTGKAYTVVGAQYSLGGTVAVMADGRIVLAGTEVGGAGWDFGGARFQANGVLDTTFNVTGKVVTDLGSTFDRLNDMVVLEDGRAVLVGTIGNAGANNDTALLRYRANGTLDTTFNGTGKKVISVGTGTEAANAVAVDGEGRIVVVGYALFGGFSYVTVARCLSTGALDPSFGAGVGFLLRRVGSNDSARDVLIQPDGKILLVGSAEGVMVDSVLLMRFLPDGTADPEFNGTGHVTTMLSGAADQRGYAVALQADGKIVVAGHATLAGRAQPVILRYLPSGVLDTTFRGTGYTQSTAFPVGTLFTHVAMAPDGTIVGAGTVGTSPATDFLAARYQGGPFTPYEQWKIASLGNVFAPDAGNGDGDACVNLAEYGLVLDPTAFSNGPTGEPHAYPEGMRLRMVFTRDPARNDVTLEAEAAPAMEGPWTVVASSVLGAPFTGAGYVGGDDAGPGLKTVEVRDGVNVGEPGSPSRFLRLRVKR